MLNGRVFVFRRMINCTRNPGEVRRGWRLPIHTLLKKCKRNLVKYNYPRYYVNKLNKVSLVHEYIYICVVLIVAKEKSNEICMFVDIVILKPIVAVDDTI